jgi:hypothetical protein
MLLSYNTPSGISTNVSAGLDTPDMIELRKRKTLIESDMDSSNTDKALYKILPEKNTSVGVSMMGSSKVYDISLAKSILLKDQLLDGEMSDNIDIEAHDLNELEISDIVNSSQNGQLKNNRLVSENKNNEEDMKQNKKRKKDNKDTGSSTYSSSNNSNDKEKIKKYKEFKF